MGGLVLAITTYGSPLPQSEDLSIPPEGTATDATLTLTDFATPPEETATDGTLTLTGPPPAETSINPLTLADSLVDTSGQSDTPELQDGIPLDQPLDLALTNSVAVAMEAACDLDPREPKTWAASGAELLLNDYLKANGPGWYNSSFLEQVSNDIQRHGSMASPGKSLIATKASLVAKETRLYAPSHRYQRTATPRISISHAS